MLDDHTGITTKEYDFFISYSNRDFDKVSPIIRHLEKEYKAKCWFQLKDSKAEFIDAIMDGIEKSKAFIIFISPDSANSYFVLNEVIHAVECRQEDDTYQIVPIVIDPDNQDIGAPVYKKIRFYLGRMNILFCKDFSSVDELSVKIFEQAGIEIPDETLRESLYHTSESEAKRLQAQNEILCKFTKEYFDKIVKPNFVILDVGCAAGDSISMRLSGLDYTALLGIDLDADQIRLATEKYGSAKNTFAVCNVFYDSFIDILDDFLENQNSFGFDLIHISAVLLHLAEPIKLLHILRRFLKKSGYLLIQDEDDGANIVYPSSSFFDNAFAIWEDSLESGDRHCGRKIPSYLNQAGFKTVCLLKCGVSNCNMTPEESNALWDIYFNYHLWLAADENTFRNVAKANLLLQEYKEKYEAHKAKYDSGNIFLQLGFLFFMAQK